MKRIFLALFILIATSSLAQVNVVGYIQTNGVANYPTHIDSMGKGGYVVVSDTTQRNAITCLRRKYGMAAYVQSEQKLYILKDSNCANIWVEFSGGGGGGSATTYTPIDLKNNGDYALVGNSYYNIHVGSDTADALYPGFLIFPAPNTYTGQRITIVNNDTGYKFPAYIVQSIYDVPLLEGTNNLVTCIPYGMTYEFVSMNGYWYATTLKQRETRANLVVGTIGIDTPPYDLNSCNAIYQFTRFRDKYDSTIVGTINFPPAYYINGSDTIPINDGQRITIVNDQANYPIAIGENKPYKTAVDGFGAGTNYGVIDTIPPQITYEFVSVGGYWRLATPIFIPEYFGASVASVDYQIKTYGIYTFASNSNNVLLPDNPKYHRGETIIIYNNSGGSLNVKLAGAGFITISTGSTATIMGISDAWVTTSVYP
jgi:hypothetical protein